MEKLNSVNDLEIYLQFGDFITPFLDADYIREKVMIDYNNKIARGINVTVIDCLMCWIDHVIKYSEDPKFRHENKFNRSVKEIWESKLTTGCTDYAMVFACFARQLGYPTTILHTADYNWLELFLNKKEFKVYCGHTFCECFVDNKWVLVDPTNRKVVDNYNVNKLELDYSIHDSKVYYPYLRSVTMQKEGTKKHNEQMEKYCADFTL